MMNVDATIKLNKEKEMTLLIGMFGIVLSDKVTEKIWEFIEHAYKVPQIKEKE